jgi:hypothetical protein
MVAMPVGVASVLGLGFLDMIASWFGARFAHASTRVNLCFTRVLAKTNAATVRGSVGCDRGDGRICRPILATDL